MDSNGALEKSSAQPLTSWPLFSELVTSRETHGLSHDMHDLMTHGSCLDQRGCYSYSEFHKVQVCPSVSFESLREHQEHPPKSSVHFLSSAVNWWVNVGQSSILRLSWDGDSLHAREKPQLAGSPAHKGWGDMRCILWGSCFRVNIQKLKGVSMVSIGLQIQHIIFCEIFDHVGCAPRQRQVPLQQSAPPLALCRTNLADQNPSKSIRYQFFFSRKLRKDRRVIHQWDYVGFYLIIMISTTVCFIWFYLLKR